MGNPEAVFEGMYEEHIKKLLAQYRAAMDNHLKEMENLMEMQAIPIYTRWQELKAQIRAFEVMVENSERTLRFLDRMHNSKHAKQN